MNINKVYLCDICRVISRNEDGSLRCRPIKRTLVYRLDKNGYSRWIDMGTKEEYSFGVKYSDRLFIRKETMIPVTSMIETKRTNMSKRKIYKEVKKKVKE